MYKDLILKTFNIEKPKGLSNGKKIITICERKNITYIVQMYDTDFEITYNFWTGHQNLNFNEAFSISNLIFFND